MKTYHERERLADVDPSSPVVTLHVVDNAADTETLRAEEDGRRSEHPIPERSEIHQRHDRELVDDLEPEEVPDGYGHGV